MEHSMPVFRALFVISICVSRCTSQYPRIQAHLPNISLDNIIDYVKPYIQSLKIGPETVLKRSFDQIRQTQNVQEAIDGKIVELEKFFQDSDVIEIDKDKKNTQDEETTIIEFVPKTHAHFKKLLEDEQESITKIDIRKYKNMRNKIKLSLEKEKVSSKTKKMVTKTLDEMIAKLLSSKCSWDQSGHVVRGTYLDTILNNSFINCYNANNTRLNEEDCKALLQNITSTFIHNIDFGHLGEDMKKFYENTMNRTKNFFKEFTFPPFFNEKNANLRKTSPPGLSDRYKLRCEFIDMERVKASGLRRKSSCVDFRVCSGEFKNFLAGFYNALNDTTVSAFRNYAAMYIRDANTDDSDEKNAVAVTLNNVSDIVEDRTSKVFIKKLSKIYLDVNKNADTNIEAIKEYIKTTVRHVIKKIKKHIEEDLKNLRARILLSVKEDIIMNLDVDLGNLETNYLGKICMLFVTCNGEVSGSLRKGYRPVNNDIKQNNVYVKVQLSLDNQVKDSLAKNGLQRLTKNKSGEVIDVGQPNDNFAASEIRATRTTLNTAFTTNVRSNATLEVSDSSESEAK